MALGDLREIYWNRNALFVASVPVSDICAFVTRLDALMQSAPTPINEILMTTLIFHIISSITLYKVFALLQSISNKENG